MAAVVELMIFAATGNDSGDNDGDYATDTICTINGGWQL